MNDSIFFGADMVHSFRANHDNDQVVTDMKVLESSFHDYYYCDFQNLVFSHVQIPSNTHPESINDQVKERRSDC